ncbi:hypothetical protein DNR46_03500 [Mesorhizobium japonicum]|uniref:OmpA-like domain-containing protein n=1 Tax=Mesorhizobium japonicum TaxID=2066070 RepID=A0A3M9XFW3_9HYPH|nr:hypothetical protein DNR46_03500 [Mesorhizobium japonicum]
MVAEGSLSVLFRAGNAELSSAGRSRLRQFAKLAVPMGKPIILEGYGDFSSSDDFDFALAQLRIDRVRAELLSSGCQDWLVYARGMGHGVHGARPDDVKSRRRTVRVVIVQ